MTGTTDSLQEAVADYIAGSADAFREIVALTHEDLRLFAAVRLPSAELLTK